MREIAAAMVVTTIVLLAFAGLVFLLKPWDGSSRDKRWARVGWVGVLFAMVSLAGMFVAELISDEPLTPVHHAWITTYTIVFVMLSYVLGHKVDETVKPWVGRRLHVRDKTHG